MRPLTPPLPLWERWLREAKTGEGFSPRVHISSRRHTPHPALRATFSHKGRREGSQPDSIFKQPDQYRGRHCERSEAIHLSVHEATMDCFASLAMTDGYEFAISRRNSPEVCWITSRPLSEGAGKTGCAPHPRSRVLFAQTKVHTSIQVRREHPGLPCAMALRLTSSSPR